MRARPTTPPTTPPAIAPTLFDSPELEASEPSAGSSPVDELPALVRLLKGVADAVVEAAGSSKVRNVFSFPI